MLLGVGDAAHFGSRALHLQSAHAPSGRSMHMMHEGEVDFSLLGQGGAGISQLADMVTVTCNASRDAVRPIGGLESCTLVDEASTGRHAEACMVLRRRRSVRVSGRSELTWLLSLMQRECVRGPFWREPGEEGSWKRRPFIPPPLGVPGWQALG